MPSWIKDLSDQGITDDHLIKIIQMLEMSKIRWLDLRFNQITSKGLEILCAANLPELEVVALYGNPCGEPTETFNIDLSDGNILTNSIKTNSLARNLEIKFGYKKWFHPITEYGEPFPLPKDLSRNPIFADEEDFFK